MKLNIDELEYKFKFHENEQMPATMTLFMGQFQIRGFRIMKSQYTDNSKRFVLFPPANRTGRGKWIKIFFTEIKDDWALLEQRALAQFDIEHTDYLIGKEINRSNDNKEIKAEDIDFNA